MTPAQYCQAKATPTGSSLYYSLLFVPEEKRRALTALMALVHEIDSVTEIHEPSVAQAKLGWWVQELGRMLTHQSTHPVTQALKPAITAYELNGEDFKALISAAHLDLTVTAYPRVAELLAYLRRGAGTVGRLAARINGLTEPATCRYAEDLSIALKLTGFLRALGRDIRRARLYIPLEELDQYGLSPDTLLTQPATSPALQALLSVQAARVRAFFQQAYASLPEADRYRQRQGLILARLNEALLDEIEADGFRVLEHRLALTPLRKLWIAWRTAYTEQRRHQKVYKRERLVHG